MIKRTAILLLCIFVLLTTAAILATSKEKSVSDQDAVTLKGITGVCVVVEKIGAEAVLDGLSPARIRKTVETILADAGVEVISESEMLKHPGKPYFYLIINLSKDERALLYAYHFRAELRQSVLLARDPEISSTSATWQSSEPTGIIGVDKLDLLSAAAEKCATEFVIDYLKANQK